MSTMNVFSFGPGSNDKPKGKPYSFTTKDHYPTDEELYGEPQEITPPPAVQADPEPIAPDDPLLELDNVLLTPHCAGINDEMMRLCSQLCYNVLKA